MSNWVSWDELLNQGIKSFEILEYLKEGLQPYSRPDNPIYCPYKYHRYTYLEKKCCGLNNLIKEFEEAGSLEKIFSQGTEFLLDNYLIKSFEKYNREVAAKYRIKINDERFDLYGQFANLSKFEQYLENKRKETIKEMEDIVDDDPNLNEDQKKLSWKYFIIPDSEEKYNNIVLKLKNAFFKKEDVKTIQNKKTTKQDKTKVFPCNPGTKWDDIEITLVDHETVRIKTPYNSGQFTYRELGMSFKTNANKQKKTWQILKLFARYNGRLDSEIPESVKRILLNDYNIDYYRKLPEYTKVLNKKLQEIFGIKDSIFKYHYNKHKEYTTKIKFSDHRHIESSEFNIEKPLHETEVKNIQNKQGIPDIKRFDG